MEGQGGCGGGLGEGGGEYAGEGVGEGRRADGEMKLVLIGKMEKGLVSCFWFDVFD